MSGGGGDRGLVHDHDPSVPNRGTWASSEGDVHDARVGVEVQAVPPALAAQAAGLDPAERGAQISHIVRVEPDHPGLHRVGDPVAAAQVLGPDVGGQAVARCRWPARSRRSSASNGVTHTTGPKISSRKMRISGVHVREHRRRQVVARGQVGGPLPARDQPGALIPPGLHVGHDPLIVLGVDQRAHLRGRVGRPADPDPPGPPRQPLDQFVVDRPLGQDPGARGAPLAVQREHPEQGAVGAPGLGRRRRRRCMATCRPAPSTAP